MTESYIFSGFGFVTGRYEVTNDDIERYMRASYLEGFDADRIASSDEYRCYRQLHAGSTPAAFMLEHKMGFCRRFHVMPFPPAAEKLKEAENSTDLCVAAVAKALTNSHLTGNDIDAWFVGTATPQQLAPGIAEFTKAYFTDIDNHAPTYSLTSACVGFNLNLENAILYFKTHASARHILLAHSEVMSALLFEERDFVPFSTFGDGAAAVVLSRVATSEREGVVAICNGEDPRMLDFLGADRKGRLYMNPRMVKARAVPNITATAQKLMQQCGCSVDDLLFFLPHQTGNAIVDAVTAALAIPPAKVFKDIQLHYGNLSGASIPACLTLLKERGQLVGGGMLIASVAGLGGEFGGFAYRVPQQEHKFESHRELDGRKIIITGGTGALGREIATAAAQKGADIIVQYNHNEAVAKALKANLTADFGVHVDLVQADFATQNGVQSFINDIVERGSRVDYCIFTHATTGSLQRASKVERAEYEHVMQTNYLSIKEICLHLTDIVSDSFLITGSVAEEAQFAGSTAYVTSKRALRSFATDFADIAYKKNIRCVHYVPGVIDAGMVNKLNQQQRKMSLMTIRQNELIPVKDIALRMLTATFRLKIPNVRTAYEGNLKVIKDSFKNF